MMTPLKPSRGVMAAGALLVLLLLFVGQQAIQTLHTLTRVERDRDTWQRPDHVLQHIVLRKP